MLTRQPLGAQGGTVVLRHGDVEWWASCTTQHVHITDKLAKPGNPDRVMWLQGEGRRGKGVRRTYPHVGTRETLPCMGF